MTANNNKENDPLVSDQPSYDGSAAHHHEAKMPPAVQRRYCRRTLLTRHLFAALTQRMWDFAVVMLLTVVGSKEYRRLVDTGCTVSDVKERKQGRTKVMSYKSTRYFMSRGKFLHSSTLPLPLHHLKTDWA